ncbi:MAG: radical SAM family heme chaperone HemW [Clostridia bacterium]|nr:radical SAM family heme chaperone HemW [Clostridia bacterium]
MPLVFPAAALVKSLHNNAGLYINVPFCVKKCKYCDFYSSFITDELLDSYKDALIRSIKQWGGKFDRPIDTIYFGGGTPSLLSYRLPEIMSSITENFNILPNSEITLELNPSGDINNILKYAKKSGFNRLSIGMQSGINSELKVLGRTHTALDTINSVKLARDLGFNNISLDIMIGLPDSDISSLRKSLDLLLSLKPEHISSYILKIEEKTVFYKLKDSLNLPDEDSVAEQYLFMSEYLEKKGYKHYEISNFCKTDFQSRHNTKYWKLYEYLGIGAAAHSFIDNKRFFYPKDLKGFIKGNEPIFDDFGGKQDEYIMLGLRLAEGISGDFPQSFMEKCKIFEKNGLMKIENRKISLTNNGMLVSNAIISELLECLE